MPRARLGSAAVTEAGASLADEIGVGQLSMGLVAERVGVKTPSLYKHVGGLADLTYRIAVLAMGELGDCVRDAAQGRAGTDALIAVARAMRMYVKEHPGRYRATNIVTPGGPEDPFVVASDRLLRSLAAVLHGYRISPAEEIHALRMLRSMLHGFVTLELEDGFRLGVDASESFDWMINTIDHALRFTYDRDGRPSRLK
ncbi:TetR-like C-terminal domain-containing protein [Ferrimicrobium sp.]|uniref:TetR/AcrR family transcriptional regulator n=1 Tax=Ferrimicrobium sp. TaxID=2926050 RepID=UPI00260354AB|nr:TetR-like C-terminal domain-containing protein [Ferrimicrobium sp.]